MADIHELIIEDESEHDKCYVIEAPKDNIIAVTSDHDLAHHIFEFLSKQYGYTSISEYLDVDTTYFIAAKDTSLVHKVDKFVNELREKGDAYS